MNQSRRLAPQRGTSLLGLVVIAIIVGFFALMAMRVFPSVNEYLTIRKVVSQIMKNQPGSASEIRNSFARATDVEYSIHTITANDLVVTQAGDHLKTTYAYNVEIPIVEPVFLLVKYEGSASSGSGGGATP
jgi:hypothetical protein